MTFRIHFQWPDGTYDHIDISGEDVIDIRRRAAEALAERGADTSTCWSEEISE